MNSIIRPAQKLEGLIINDEWKVIRKAKPEELSTGGRYTQGYIVERDGQTAWMKALDWSEVQLVNPDVSKIIEEVLASYNYEADLHKFCVDKSLNNVVRIYDSGHIVLEEYPTLPVFYLILEKGIYDVRNEMEAIKQFDYFWVFRTVHQIAKGLNQLHNIKVVHQDLKPSNIITFSNGMKKIGDLGSAYCKDDISKSQPGYHEKRIPGTYEYAPIELLYKEVNPNWEIRRKAGDLYQLGSIIVFFLTKMHMNAFIKSHLHFSLHWDRDNDVGTYRDIIEHIINAFERSLAEISNEIKDDYLRGEIIPVIRQLCNPIPENRGHPRNFLEKTSNLSMIRYMTIFARIYKHYELYSKN